MLAELDWRKNVDLDCIYKKCGFRKNKDFCKRHTWKISDNEYVSVYAKDNGRATTENKYELPPPIDNRLYFGSLAIVKHTEEEPNNDNYLNLSKTEWKKIYENLMGGFEDLDDDEEESEEEYVDPKDLTKHGYKKDGFVVEDNNLEFNSGSEEEEEWIPSQEETEDSLEDNDDEEEIELQLETDSPEEDEEESDDDDILEMGENSNNELEEEDYAY